MEGFPVQEEQQEQGQMDSVLVKLQLELQEQLQPSPAQDAAGNEPSTQLLVARLAPVGDDVSLQHDDVTPQHDDIMQQQGDVTDSMHSEITLRRSSGSVASLPGAAEPQAATEAAADASAAAAVSDALSHSMPTAIPSAAAAKAAAAKAAAGDSDAAESSTRPAAVITDDLTPTAGDTAAAEVTPSGHFMVTPLALTPGSHSRATSDRCLSVTDDEWHMVSRGSSVKAASSSGRYSFEEPAAAAAMAAAMTAAAAAAGSARSEGATTPLGLASGAVSPFSGLGGMTDAGSECGSDATPRDELAASILGHPVMMAAAAEVEGYTEGGIGSTAAAAGADAAAAVGELAAAGSSDEPAAAAAAAAMGDDDAAVVLDTREALGLLSGGLLSLAGGLREWLVESLAALVQTGRESQAACMSRAASALRSLQLSAKESGGLAAAAAAAAGDWRLLLSSAAAVVCLALWMKSRKEANVLRLMLRRRDHELSKLVMRVVSLQELINQGGHLAPSISRYTRFEGAAVTATYM